MALPRHYLRFLPQLKLFASDIVPSAVDWQHSIFNDITEKGTKLTLEPLSNNEHGKRIGLCGDIYYCEAALDRERDDSIFIFKVENAVRRQLKTPPRLYPGHFELLTSRFLLSNLDPIKDLESLTARSQSNNDNGVPQLHPSLERPSEPLLRILSGVHRNLRSAWHPITIFTQPSSSEEFIDLIRKPWTKFQLEKYSQLNPRQESLIKKMVKLSGGRRERERLLLIFNINLLNSFAYDNAAKPDLVCELLSALATLPLRQHLRAAIWTGMLNGLEEHDLLRELYDVADQLLLLSASPQAAVPWEDHILELLRTRAESTRSSLIQDLFENSCGQVRALEYLAQSVKKLEFEGSQVQTQTAPEPVVLPEPTPIAAMELPDESTTEAVDLPASLIVQTASEPASLLTIEHTRSDQFEKWVLGLQAIDQEQAANLAENIWERLSIVIQKAANCTRVVDLCELSSSLKSIGEQIPLWLSALPELSRLTDDYHNAVAAYESAYQIAGPSLETLLTEGNFTPRDLAEATKLLQNREVLLALPRWVLGPSIESKEVPKAEDPYSWLRLLIIPQVRGRVTSAVSCFDEIGHGDLPLLSLVAPIPNDSDDDDEILQVDQHIRKWFTNIWEILDQLPEITRAQFHSTKKSAAIHSQLRQCVGICQKLRGRAASGVIGEIAEHLISAPDEGMSLRQAELYLEAIEFFEKYIGRATDASFAQVQSRVEQRMREPISIAEDSQPQNLQVTVEHNWIDAHGGKVPLTYFPHPDQATRPYGYVSAPFVLAVRQKHSCMLKVGIDVITKHREAWPRDWEGPAPSQIQITEDAWRNHPDVPDQYIHTFKIRIPIRLKSNRFEFQITLTNAETGKSAGKPTTFSWDLIHDSLKQPVMAAWSRIPDANNVEKHPIGPQKRSQEVLTRLIQGGSFCVTAPRRFGKTTFVQFLRLKAEQHGFLAPEPVACTSYFASASGVDYAHLWQDVSDRLQAALGSSIVRPKSDGILDENAFDHVRRAATRKKHKGIVILFDEAQLFFPAKDDFPFSHIIKDRLELHWSSVNKTDMVPVLFGFIGLPSLGDRIGANLAGLLSPMANTDLEEGELNALILSVTAGALNTTREARRRLARTAGNIFILQTLVDRLLKRVQEDSRTWANYDDVVSIEAGIRDGLREGNEPDVSRSIRDILNDAEDVNKWEPSAALPLAIAVADARSRGTAPPRLYDEARSRLNSWYDSAAASDSTRLVYDEPQFNEHLRILQERGILRNREFPSGLVEDWLLGFPKQVDDQEWKRLLQVSAIKRIKIPRPLQRVEDADGGEASVWTSTTRDQIKYAYRISRLRSEVDRIRFAETREILESLKARVRDGTRGSQYIFKLEDVGISCENDSEALQVYRWVEGADLSRHIGKLSAAYVTDLGTKLAQAIQFLHSFNIVHRDLSPRNIIVAEEGGDPVIIDFGFARRLTADVKTVFDGSYSAPEVRGPATKWTKAADIFSLGSTLSAVLAPKEQCIALREILDACQDTDPGNRPEATGLISLLKEVAEDLDVEERKERIWQKVLQDCKEDYDNFSWLRRLMEKFSGNFKSVGLGCFASQFDRCRGAANFLNQALEAWPKAQQGNLSLGKVKDDNVTTGKSLATDPIKFMHAIRKYDSHGAFLKKERTISKFSYPSDQEMIAIARDAAQSIGEFLNILSLSAVVEHLL